MNRYGFINEEVKVFMLRALNLGDCCAMVRRAAYIRAVLDRVEHAALIGVML